MRAVDLEPGARYGRLVVVGVGVPRKAAGRNRRTTECRCDCGATVTVDTSNLRSGNSTSCGCSKRDAAVHGGRAMAARLTTHGLFHHPHYTRWYNMIQRCQHAHHRAFPDYGGRGIGVAPEWLEPAPFLEYVDTVLGPCPPGSSLDRIDNDGDYAPGNIRWATKAEQAQNRRKRAS